MQCAAWAANGPNHLGLCARQACHVELATTAAEKLRELELCSAREYQQLLEEVQAAGDGVNVAQLAADIETIAMERAKEAGSELTTHAADATGENGIGEASEAIEQLSTLCDDLRQRKDEVVSQLMAAQSGAAAIGRAGATGHGFEAGYGQQPAGLPAASATVGETEMEMQLAAEAGRNVRVWGEVLAAAASSREVDALSEHQVRSTVLTNQPQVPHASTANMD